MKKTYLSFKASPVQHILKYETIISIFGGITVRLKFNPAVAMIIISGFFICGGGG